MENDTFRTKLHWIVKDIVASPVKSIIREGNGETVIPYLPPHPYRGMKYHRYPIFLFEQPSDEWLASRSEVFRLHKEQVLQHNSTAATSATTDGIKVPVSLTIPTTGGTALRAYTTDVSKSKYGWTNLDRDNFSIRAWANQMGMKPVGAHIVRCEWDSDVAGILESLRLPERAFKKIRSEETSPFDFAYA